MGNWRRVWIQVTIPKKDVGNVRDFVNEYGLWNYNGESNDDCDIVIVWDNNVSFTNYPSIEGYQISDNENLTTQKPFFEFFVSDSNGISGIGDWVDSNVDVVGNIGKGASNEEIMKEWTFIAAKFPEIKGEIHVCDNYESKYCVGRVVVGNGRVSWNAPTINKIKADQSREEINLAAILSRVRY
ncbi:putative orfan [Tupanvirus soda lake]|uniref:Orfan n=1 Tax=Tupanvirus deep ocean TaxID=2126984 RepID=A0A2K9L5E5_9VIRU|nr:putative orfan [Tupanvirus soda lake]AUL78145.2 putative orfan [Tupanvirus soda lake]